MSEQEQLNGLALQLAHAKATEDQATAKRIEIEEQIAALVPTEEVGQATVKVADGTKLVVKRGLNYKADVPAVEATFRELPSGPDDEPLPLPIKSKTTRSLDEKGYEWYRQNRPDVFAKIAPHVTVTPKKVSVELKVK